VATKNVGLSQFDKKTETFKRVDLQNSAGRFAAKEAVVLSIVQDEEGLIWVGTENSGLYCVESSGFGNVSVRKHFAAMGKDGMQRVSNAIIAAKSSKDSTLWFGTIQGLSSLKKGADNFEHVEILSRNKNAKTFDAHEKAVSAIFEDQSGFLWLGTLSGLVKFDKTSKAYQLFPHRYEVDRYGWGRITDIKEGHDGQLWLITPAGLMTFDRATGAYNYILHDPENPESISFNITTCLEKDRSGLMWIGTAGMGINIHNHRAGRFHKFSGKNRPYSRTSGFSVRSVFQENDSIVWISCEVLFKWNRNSGELQNFERTSKELLSFGNTFVSAITKDGNGLIWFASSEGLYALNAANGKINFFQPAETNTQGMPEKKVHHFARDREGRLWAVSSNYLMRIVDFERGVFESIWFDTLATTQHSDNTIAYFDQMGRVWIGNSKGLHVLNLENRDYKLFQHVRADSSSLSNNSIKALCPDPENPHFLWIGTAGGGLNKFDLSTEKFIAYTETDGLSNNVVYAILPDKHGALWMSTNGGISRFDPATESFTTYDNKDGLQSNEFNTGAYLLGDDCEMFFGGIKGLNYFHPDSIEAGPSDLQVAFTNLKIHNVDINSKSPKSPLKFDIAEMELLYLPYDMNSLEFSFAGLEFSCPESIQYAYMLTNFNEDWVYAGNSNTATFTNISPGTYFLKVKAANKNGAWSESGAEIKIIIASPWWATWWAYSLYGLILLMVLFLLRKYEINRIRVRNQLKMEKLETETLRQLDSIKNKFFNNISHEFRTPLTLIMGQLEHLKQSQNLDEETSVKITMAESNAGKLLVLINQLMDIAKIQADKLDVNNQAADIVSFIEAICQKFEILAASRGIKLIFETSMAHIIVWFDEDKVEKILSNLISNALKFTPEGGTVCVAISVQSNVVLQISVKDSGIGISKEHLPYIFDRFYQVDHSHTRAYEGTGIGLSLVKELVELLSGNIAVKSNIGKGTEFLIALPFKMAESGISGSVNSTDSFAHSEITISDSNGNETPEIRTKERIAVKKEIVLVVEDNAEVRRFIVDILSDKYRVLEANNGLKGIELAQLEMPDLIVTDVMMPEMDGFAFVKQIRDDVRSSHIPVIMVTGLHDNESKLLGLESGVDAYIQKPFSVAELQVRVRKLIEQRRELRQKFGNRIIENPTEISPQHADQSFMEKVMSEVALHYENPLYGVEALAEAVHMSTSQLSRKLNALVDQPPGHIIRTFRLQKAAEMLEAETGNVSEVCYRSGFSDQAYFSRAFKKAYGSSPGRFQQERKKAVG
jgi:signal transduction histidine kinase/ligand-binding sensor domain-containing protein/CheY-like chemotaxis protein